MLLEDLAVGREAEQVYRLLLKRGTAAVDEVCRASSMSREDVEASLAQLRELGFVQAQGEGDFAAVNPAICVERLVEERLAALRRRLRRVDAVRLSISELGRDFSSGAKPSAADIERITDGADVWARLDELSFFAYHEVLAVHPSAPWRAKNIEAARPLDLRCLRRGLRMRLVAARQTLNDPLTRAYLMELASAGAQVRCTDEAVQRMIIAVVVRQPGLVSGLVELFERTWQESVDIVGAESAGNEPTEIERQVLGLLTRVDKDEAAARELGVSLRTFQRHLANVMTRLNTTSRFQAALSAKQRGWI